MAASDRVRVAHSPPGWERAAGRRRSNTSHVDLASDGALDRVVELHAVFLEQGAEGVVEGDLGFLVVGAGGDLGGARLGKIALVLDDEELGGLAGGEAVSFGFEELVLQIAALAGGGVGGEGGLDGDDGGLDLFAGLLGELDVAGLGLSELDGVSGGVGTGDAVADGKGELNTGLVDGGGAQAAKGEILGD